MHASGLIEYWYQEYLAKTTCPKVFESEVSQRSISLEDIYLVIIALASLLACGFTALLMEIIFFKLLHIKSYQVFCDNKSQPE